MELYIRDYFYLNSSRYKNKPNASDAHLSLAEGRCKAEKVDRLRAGLTNGDTKRTQSTNRKV
ncbi:MAG: hypothetical protein WC988_03985 [Patescibacteria group bacterium]